LVPLLRRRRLEFYQSNRPINYNLNIIYSAQSVGATYNLQNEKKEKSTFHMEGAFHYGIDLIK
jgi:hypothetical protein